jgi:hypothetical protein
VADRLPLHFPTGRITFATIEALTLEAATHPAEALERALVAGTRIERHGRVWRMGQWRHEGRAIVGRIGFESSATAELWDDDVNDFRETSRPLGLTSPFAIDPGSLRVAFQLRGRDIRVKSFTGALQALLNEASPTDRWRVARETRVVPFEQWASEVDRVTDLRLHLERPNPHYADRDRIRAIVEGTNSRLVEIAAHADPEDPQGLDLNDPLIREAISHAELNYGHFSATAERAGETSQWTSQHDAMAEVRTAPADPDTKEVSPSVLRRELGDPTAELEAAEEARAAVEEHRASTGDDPEDADEFDLLDDDSEES